MALHKLLANSVVKKLLASLPQTSRITLWAINDIIYFSGLTTNLSYINYIKNSDVSFQSGM